MPASLHQLSSIDPFLVAAGPRLNDVPHNMTALNGPKTSRHRGAGLHSRGILCKFIRSGITQKTARCRRAGERPDGAPYTYEVARSMSSNFRSGKSHGSE